jgi:branched-subunit amino acid transport protein
MTDELWTIVTIVGMTCMTVLTRSFFFLSRKPWKLPKWGQRGLQYAPVAALAAVIAPEVLMTDGHVITNLLDARLFGAVAGLGWYYARRTVLGTITLGMLVYLPLHIGLGW